MNIKSWLKTYVIPSSVMAALRPWYHGCCSVLAHWAYGRPSNRLVLVAVTGTAGKSTTAQMLAHILNQSGRKAGFTTTVGFFDGNEYAVNRVGLSMANEFELQRQLRHMADNGCKYAVMEATSEGLAQNRHWGLNIDMALFTNLSPAHIDAHKSFENYRAAKARLFAAVAPRIPKPFFSKKIIGVNLDDPEAGYFLSPQADERFGVTFGHASSSGDIDDYFDAVPGPGIMEFTLRHTAFRVPLVGEFNLQNALLAAAAANVLGVELPAAARALESMPPVDGRMQEIPGGRGFRVFVDYAPEPAAMRRALESVNVLPHRRIIHVFGSTGGHRDVSKRFEFGKISAHLADMIIITNDDVYDSDPEEIARNIREGIGRVRDEDRKAKDAITVLDRKDAIMRALSMAGSGDIIIITGKGSEQFLVLPGNKRVQWDEPALVKNMLSA